MVDRQARALVSQVETQYLRASVPALDREAERLPLPTETSFRLDQLKAVVDNHTAVTLQSVNFARDSDGSGYTVTLKGPDGEERVVKFNAEGTLEEPYDYKREHVSIVDKFLEDAWFQASGKPSELDTKALLADFFAVPLVNSAEIQTARAENFKLVAPSQSQVGDQTITVNPPKDGILTVQVSGPGGRETNVYTYKEGPPGRFACIEVTGPKSTGPINDVKTLDAALAKIAENRTQQLAEKEQMLLSRGLYLNYLTADLAVGEEVTLPSPTEAAITFRKGEGGVLEASLTTANGDMIEYKFQEVEGRYRYVSGINKTTGISSPSTDPLVAVMQEIILKDSVIRPPELPEGS